MTYDISNLDLEAAVEEIEATEETPNLDIVIEQILSSKDSYEDTGKYDEELEASRRSNAMFIAYYCENGPTYDPSGKYLCKTCKARNLPDSCAWVSGKISMDAGSCMIYMIGKSSEQPLPVKLTQIQTQYTERPNIKTFGCSRCEYGKEAKEEDNAGRSLWCKFWGMHVMEPACCMKNEGEDDILAPGDKEIEATNHDDNLRKAEDIKMGLYAEQILDELEAGGPGSGRHKIFQDSAKEVYRFKKHSVYYAGRKGWVAINHQKEDRPIVFSDRNKQIVLNHVTKVLKDIS